MYIRTYICMYIAAHVHVCTLLHMFMHVLIVCMWGSMACHMCMYVHVCACTYMYIHVCACAGGLELEGVEIRVAINDKDETKVEDLLPKQVSKL